MRKARLLGVVSSCLLLSAVALAAGGHRMPDRYAPGSLDGTPIVVEDAAHGRTWSAWAYRNGAEYDIAVSVLDGSGVWSEPVLFGRDDGVDQTDPALAIDADGTVYLAFAVADARVIRFATLREGTGSWIGPVTAAHTQGAAGAPALLLVADRAVLAYRDGESVRMLAFRRLAAGAISTFGIQEGPDVIDPLGRLPVADSDGLLDDDENGRDETRQRNRSGVRSFGRRGDVGRTEGP